MDCGSIHTTLPAFWLVRARACSCAATAAAAAAAAAAPLLLYGIASCTLPMASDSLGVVVLWHIDVPNLTIALKLGAHVLGAAAADGVIAGARRAYVTSTVAAKLCAS